MFLGSADHLIAACCLLAMLPGGRDSVRTDSTIFVNESGVGPLRLKQGRGMKHLYSVIKGLEANCPRANCNLILGGGRCASRVAPSAVSRIGRAARVQLAFEAGTNTLYWQYKADTTH